jgi:hypothetical protein
MIFGQGWFHANKVIINYAKMTCTIRTFGNSRHTIYPLSRGTVIDHNPTKTLAYLQKKASEGSNDVSCDVVSAKRAVKSLVKGMDYMILMVRHCPSSGEKPCIVTTNGCGTKVTALGHEKSLSRPNESIIGLKCQTGNVRGNNVLVDQLVATQQPSKPKAMVASGLKHKDLRMNDSQARLQTQSAEKVPSILPYGLTVGTERNDCSHGREDRISKPDVLPQGTAIAHDELLVREEDIKCLLEKYKHVFPEELPSGLPPDRGTGHTIRLEGNAAPPFRRNKRMSPAEYELCQLYVGDLLKKGLITPSTSPFGAPIMFVAKPKGGYRVVCDWRMLNKLTIKNRYPLPRIDETLDRLAGATVFSSLDLNSGYFQIRISEEDAHKTAFTTPIGHFEFKVLGQGLANSPATFQSVMNRIFAPHFTHLLWYIWMT